MKLKRKQIIFLASTVVLLIVWLMINPPGRFGISFFGYTTFNGWPRPILDFQVRADGETRQVVKTHDLTFDKIEWLLDPKPEVLIIALGWDGVTKPEQKIREYKDCEVRLLKNREAIELFNRLKRAGRRVAIHYHSTC